MRSLAILTILTLTPAAAFAQPSSQPEIKGAFAPGFVPGGVFALPPAERYAAIDKNKDQKVTKDEYAAVLNSDAKPFIEAIWRNRDTNNDGWLTLEELVTNGPQRRPGGAGQGQGGQAAGAPRASAAAAGQ